MIGNQIFKMKTGLYIFLLFVTTFACAQHNPKGKDLIDHEKIKYLSTKGNFSNIEKLKDKNGELQFLIETTEEPKFIYNAATNFPILKKGYKKGTVFLLSFQAKTKKSSLETGEAKVLFIFKQTKDYKGNIDYTQSFSSEWQTYHLPFEADRYIKKQDLGIVMQYGYRPQSFLIKDIKFEVFPSGTTMESLPKTEIKYAGMEADANWRSEANKRIEVIRKGDFKIQLLKDGKPVADKSLTIKLKNHAFPFGARMAAEDIVNDADDYKNFKKALNTVVLGNDLKIKHWVKPKKMATTIKALDILKRDGYSVKGHVLIWPGFNYLTPEVKQYKNNPEKVTEIIENHVNHILNTTAGKINRWDVVNEAYTNRDLQQITGSEEILYNGFRTLAKKQPQVKRFTNEYGIISKGGIDRQKQEWYYNFIKRIDENTGGLVQGIGIQSHMGSDLTPPERVLEILAYYASLGKKISISEFTMDIQDPQLREQYTRDFMIATFSHPNVSEFMFWGNTEDGRGKSDIFDNNNKIGIMGKAYFSLVHDAWKTNLSVKTSEEGLVSGRGFYGDYEYTFKENGKVISGTFQLNPKQKDIIKIEL
ncbi:endo-1,4-beta-xylanase [Aureibaculum sp. 2210JD6-5]|uniref:endo-1,4-beta-xylanase n=1 Tax=Aureibaculum sp. 2210JD6-5 TaxID=3103957 RepID=UPI002AAD1196|nr:endo-1,4-beta-xylanase [Aureibaculum sp. 2210JD6-5]MDY7396799.1 endo-1,4-beta-xylanase [Aureibaculum sp. 2210JD6-5]